jgi:WD40 repeat protein
VTEAPHWVVLKPGPPTDWDAHSITLEGHSKAVTSVCLSDDGKYLISLSSDNNLRSWDTTTASCKQSIRDLPDCSCIALSPNGSQIAVCLSSATIHMLDSNLAISNIEIKLNHPPLLSISFSPDGKYLAGVVAGIVTIWDSATGNCERSLSEAATSLGFIDILDETYYVSFSRNGKQVVTATLGGEVKIWDVPTGSCRVAFTCAQAVTFLSQSTIMAAEECYLIVWDIQQKSRALSWLAHNDPIQSIVSLNCQGLSSASCGTDLSIKIWDQAGNLIQQLEGHGRQVNSLDFSPRNGLLASASNDHTIKLWDLTRFSSSRLNKLRGGQSASVDRRKLHVNVEQGLIADGVGQHFKRHIRWGESLKPFRETFFQSASPSVLSKLRRQIICSMAGSLANEKSFDTLRYEEHPSRILAVALSPNHHWLASVAEDASVNIWDISKSICVFTRSLGISLDLLLPSLVFSSNGNQLVLTTANIRYCFPIARFGTTTWKSVHEFWYRGFRGGKFDRSHISHLGNDGSDSKDLDIDKTFPIGAVDCGAESLSADHKLIARATGRSTVVRSITTGELIRAIPRGAAAMTFSPDGDILVLASEDCLCAYEVGTGQQLWETSTDDNPLRGRPEAVAISHGAKVLAVSWFWGDCYAWKPNIHKFPRPFLTHRNLDDKNLNSKMEVTVNEKWLVLCSRPKTYVYDLENSVLRQIIDNALYINRLILDPADNDLVHTNVGTWILRKENGIALKGNGLSFDGAWVMRDSERLLWLPSQYRSSFPSVVGSFVALGNAQGSFALLQFSP